MHDAQTRERFNGYIAKYNRNFDWSDKIYIKKEYIRYLANMIRGMDKITSDAIKEFKEMK